MSKTGELNQMRIDIKQEHINDGVQGSEINDPVALAILGRTGIDLEVYDKYIMSHHTGTGVNILKCVDEGLELSKFISRFDAEGAVAVEPLSFELSIDNVLTGEKVPEDQKTRVCYSNSFDEEEDDFESEEDEDLVGV